MKGRLEYSKINFDAFSARDNCIISQKKALQIINVCCALHNLCIQYKVGVYEQVNYPSDSVDVDDTNEQVDNNGEVVVEAGQRVRQRVMHCICSNLQRA